ncbi:hypothetical protein BSK56_31025 [Paenibacillus borealis]|uniref:Uncharacterized protein n=1 Tax=Paenibacillus borealis TaxID=160799 RepID=A0ABX3GY85_PAEBO|nr:hypothetical protein BSK56_31025 [Paenibacillus borealis]
MEKRIGTIDTNSNTSSVVLFYYGRERLLSLLAEGKFGTVGAIATAFVTGFPPHIAGTIKKFLRLQRPEVQIFTVVTSSTKWVNITSNLYIREIYGVG